MPIKWDAEADRLLLIKLVELHVPEIADCTAIAESWPADRGIATARAIQRHFLALRKKGVEEGVASPSIAPRLTNKVTKPVKKQRTSVTQQTPSNFIIGGEGIDSQALTTPPTGLSVNRNMNLFSSNSISMLPGSTPTGKLKHSRKRKRSSTAISDEEEDDSEMNTTDAEPETETENENIDTPTRPANVRTRRTPSSRGIAKTHISYAMDGGTDSEMADSEAHIKSERNADSSESDIYDPAKEMEAATKKASAVAKKTRRWSRKERHLRSAIKD